MSISTDNIVEIKEVESIEYETLSTAVNGMIELVSIKQDIDMWLNEEGKVNGLETNIIASMIFYKAFSQLDIIKGNVIITGGSDDDGNTVGLSDESIQDIFALVQSGIEQANN